MAALDATGFSIRTFNEIREDLRLRAATQDFFGEETDATPDSVLGILITLFSSGVLSQEELAQSVYDQFNRDKAEGRNLDDLAALTGIRRIAASGSTGQLLFSGDNLTTIPSGFIVTDLQNRPVTTDNENVINEDSCYNTVFSIDTFIAGEFTVTINSMPTSITTSTADDLVFDLVGDINSLIEDRSYVAEVLTGTSFQVTNLTRTNTLSVSASENITVDSIGTLVNATSVAVGALEFLPNTLVTVPNPLEGLSGVTNLISFSAGRLGEGDEELRTRIQNRSRTAGTATIPSMEASLLNLSGVTSAIVIENATEQVDSNNRPRKSFEAVVTGGEELDIAEELWRIKPAGISTFGTITHTVTDSQGLSQGVSFSRPTNIFVWVNISYTLYDEETFPTDGVDVISQTVLDYANNLRQGEDIIPQRIAANIFNNVTGLEAVNVRLSGTATPLTAPSFTNGVLPVSNVEEAVFASNRISISEA